MSENSAFWDGEITGDAASATGWEARYLSSEKVNILSLILGSDTNDGFVLPECKNELLVSESPTPALSVTVAKGTAYVGGRLYINTSSETLVIPVNATGNPRIDRIILRATYATQTIRLVVLGGVAAASPILPTLSRDANIHEVSLAYIWVANGETSIADEDIHDERQFLLSFNSVNTSYGAFNKIANSEFMALENAYSDGDKSDMSPEWISNSYAALEPETRPVQMVRGRALKLTGLETDIRYPHTLSQTFRVKPDTTYTIRAMIKTDIGNDGFSTITTNAYAPSTIYKNILRRNEWLDETFYYKTEHDATNLTFTYGSSGIINNITYIGQVLAMEGYYPGDFREFSEPIFNIYRYLGNIYGTYSTGTIIWDMATCDPDFGIYLLDGIKSLILNFVSVIDISGDPSAYGIKIRSYNGTDILFGYTPPDTIHIWTTVQGEVPLIERKFEVDYLASGANTLITGMIVVGIRT